MKSLFNSVLLLLPALLFSQQHFSGASTSTRVTMLNGFQNPAEFASIASKYDISVLGASVNASSNKIGFGDLVSGKDFEQLIFAGDEDANLRLDSELFGPGVAYTFEQWTFAVSTRAYGKLNVIDVDVNFGDAIVNAGINSILGSTTISRNNNQRLIGTTWGEVGFSAARNLFEGETSSFNAGATVKLLFPGSYANFGASRFTGTINNTLGNATLTDAQASLNIAYSGNLGNDFSSFSDYSESLFGRLNGMAVDLGVSYRLKDPANPDRHKINAGISVLNIGGMTFKSSNNSATNYELSIQGSESLNLNQFENVTSLQEIEAILLSSGYLDKEQNRTTDFKVRLPSVFSAFADIRVTTDFYVTVFGKQKLNPDDENDQITAENVISVTPRYLFSNVEVYLPLAMNEVAGFTTGFGFRAYGFYLGSASIISALISDTRQADAFIGYTFSL